MRYLRIAAVMPVLLLLAVAAFAGSTPAQPALNGIGIRGTGIGTYPTEFNRMSLLCDDYGAGMSGCGNRNMTASKLAAKNLAQLQFEKENRTWGDPPSAGLMFQATSRLGASASGDSLMKAVGPPAATIALNNWTLRPDCPPPTVPEPASLLLVGTGLVATAGMLRRKLLA